MKKLLVLVLVMCLASFASAQMLGEYNFSEIGNSADDTTADTGTRGIAGTILGWGQIIEDDGSLAAKSTGQAGGGVINLGGAGTGEYVNVGQMFTQGMGTEDRTVGGWVKSTGLNNTSWTGLIGASGNWALLFGYGSIRFAFEHGGNITLPIDTLNNGEWHAFALVDKLGVGGYQKAYIDGQLVGEIATNNTAQGDWGNVAVGADVPDNSWGDRHLQGQMDQVFFQNSAMSQAELQAYQGIPEPATIALLGLGLALLRRKNS